MGEAAIPMETEQLPMLYQRWMEELLPGGIPRERESTCGDCAMCNPDGSLPRPDDGYFHPQAKCCTYFPTLRNFLAGRILQSDAPGSDTLREFIESGQPERAIVDLLGVSPPPEFWHGYDAGFGTSEKFLCPYAIDAGQPGGPRCGIWQNRNSTCTTWFCKHVRGQTGRLFWQSALSLFRSVELELAWWTISQLFDSPGRLLIRQPSSIIANPDPPTLVPGAWQHWSGSKIDFYVKCAELVEELSWAQVEAIAGAQTRIKAEELRLSHANLLDRSTPDRLQLVPYLVVSAGAERARLRGKYAIEEFEAPNLLVQLLHYFDGSRTEDVVRRIRADHNVNLSAGLVRKLYDFGVLAPPPE